MHVGSSSVTATDGQFFYSIFDSAFSIISAREKKTGWNVNVVRYRKFSYIFRVRSEGGRVKIHTGKEELGFVRVAIYECGKKKK